MKTKIAAAAEGNKGHENLTFANKRCSKGCAMVSAWSIARISRCLFGIEWIRSKSTR